jgi:hypothetical protein
MDKERVTIMRSDLTNRPRFHFYTKHLEAFFPGLELGGDGFGAGHSGGFAGREGALEVKDFGPVGFEGFVDFFDFGVR